MIKGKEEFLRRQALQDIVSRLKKVDPELTVNYSKAKDYRKGELEEWVSPTLFGSAPLPVIEDAENLTDSLIDDVLVMIDTANKTGEFPGEVVIVHSGAVRGKKMITAIEKMSKQAGEVIPANEVKKDSEKAAFAGAQFRRWEKTASNDAIIALINYVGDDIAVLAGYIHQLADDAGEGTSINKTFVDKFFRGLLEVDVWKQIVEVAVAGDAFKALTYFRHAVQHGESPASIIPRLAMKLRQLVKVSSVVSGAMSAKEVGMQDWQVRNMQSELKRFNTERMTKSFEALAAADEAAKGGSRDGGYLAFEEAIRVIGQHRV